MLGLSTELLLYDAVLRDSLFTTLNVVLNDNNRTQASLPVRWSGITLLAPSAYLASAASTMELTSHPPYFHCIYKQQRTATSLQPCPPGNDWHWVLTLLQYRPLPLHHHRTYNVPETTSDARCSQICYWMLQQIMSFVLAFWLHALQDTGLTWSTSVV